MTEKMDNIKNIRDNAEDHGVLSRIKKDFVFYYMLFNVVNFLYSYIYYYNDPNFGFNLPGFQLGVILTVLFPIIWIMIYLFSMHIGVLRHKLDDLESKMNTEMNNDLDKVDKDKNKGGDF
ncbi:MAG: hypothetical protein ACTSU2_07595 [Promethearchaeota archaeon]